MKKILLYTGVFVALAASVFAQDAETIQTLTDIAGRFGITWSQILSLIGITYAMTEFAKQKFNGFLNWKYGTDVFSFVLGLIGGFVMVQNNTSGAIALGVLSYIGSWFTHGVVTKKTGSGLVNNTPATETKVAGFTEKVS